jgi:hypothetical protein
LEFHFVGAHCGSRIGFTRLVASGVPAAATVRGKGSAALANGPAPGTSRSTDASRRAA